MSEQGYYDVTLHTGPGIVQAHVTFPFGQWAELGYWLDEIAPGEQDTLTVKFHPVRPPLACVVDESAGQAEQHSVRAELRETNERGLSYELGIEKCPQWEEGQEELHPVASVDLDAVSRLEAFSREAEGGEA